MKPEPKIPRHGFWMENSFHPNTFIVVDCGYIRHQRARDNADRLVAAIKAPKSVRIVEIVGASRVLVRVPKAKAAILRRFRKISSRSKARYCWTTHVYEPGAPQFDVKYAI